MRYLRTASFKSQYQRLPERLQRRAEQALVFLLQNLRHPSLRAKKMEGQRDPEGRDIWEARVSQSYRLTFAIDGDTYILYRIGPHDIERRPR
jgi:mRNA-degrading endonuclease RelE of RelBE toxin-antitoxin system